MLFVNKNRIALNRLLMETVRSRFAFTEHRLIDFVFCGLRNTDWRRRRTRSWFITRVVHHSLNSHRPLVANLYRVVWYVYDRRRSLLWPQSIKMNNNTNNKNRSFCAAGDQWVSDRCCTAVCPRYPQITKRVQKKNRANHTMKRKTTTAEAIEAQRSVVIGRKWSKSIATTTTAATAAAGRRLTSASRVPFLLLLTIFFRKKH